MNLDKIKDKFKEINSLGSSEGDIENRNPNGDCSVCAAVAGEHLVDGTNPTGLPDVERINIRETYKDRWVIEYPLVDDDEKASQEPWIWFTKHAADGVYLVEQESDHCFNLVRDNSSVYLIDSNIHVFKPLNNRGEAEVDGYDYMYPEQDEDNDLLVRVLKVAKRTKKLDSVHFAHARQESKLKSQALSH